MERLDEFRQQLQNRMAALRSGDFQGVYSEGRGLVANGSLRVKPDFGAGNAQNSAERRKVGLCIGINEVSPHAYPTAEKMTLKGCCNDADRFGDLLRCLGYSVDILKNGEADRRGVERHLNKAAGLLSEGDVFAMLISSHGGRDEQADGKKHESWVLYDGLVWDEDIIAAFSRFRKGVRILIVNDQCHSGGLFLEKGANRESRRRYWSSNTADLSWTAEKAVVSSEFPQLIQFAGCRAEQASRDLGVGGAWTMALLDALVEDRKATFRSWFNRAFAKLPRGEQDPQWIEKGPVSPEFREGSVVC